MAAFTQIGPLRIGLPIVDKVGGPTPAFMRSFNSLFGNTSNVLGIANSAVAALAGKQPLDADLTAIAAFSGTGIAVRTASDTWALRTLTAPATGLSISNPAGVAGNPTFALANDLAALEALSGTHTIYYRSAADTWTAVSIGTGLDFTGATLSCTVTGYTDEQAQDSVGTILLDSSTIDFTYDDATPTITAIVKAGSIGSTELADTAVTPGTYGDSTHAAQITVDSHGRITAASQNTMSGGGGSGSWIPMVDGAEPPTFVTDGAGVLLLVAGP